MSGRHPDTAWEPGPGMTLRFAEALIEIAAGFDGSVFDEGDPDLIDCMWCGASMAGGCRAMCPGLLARRALGVA